MFQAITSLSCLLTFGADEFCLSNKHMNGRGLFISPVVDGLDVKGQVHKRITHFSFYVHAAS